MDYPETWRLAGNAALSQSVYKFGGSSVYFPDTNISVSVANTTGMSKINTLGNYELEAFVNLKDRTEVLEAQGYTFYAGHTFKVINEAVTWAEAKAACEALGGHLATSTTAEKNAFLLSIVGSTQFWLGGQMVNDAWQWITGEMWIYTNWASDEPSTTEGYDKLYINHENGTWAANNETASGGYVCEWDYDMREFDGNIFSLSGSVQKTTQTTSKLSGFSFFGGHTFKYYSTAKTWAAAKAACEALGGHLATNTSAEKNTFLHSLISANAWLGATDEAAEAT